MSNTNDNFLFETEANYTQRHVGGKNRPRNNQQYINNQVDLIRAQNKFLPPNVRYGNNNSNNINSNSNNSYSRSMNNFVGNNNFQKLLNRTNDFDNNNNSNNSSRNKVYLNDKSDERYDPYDGYLYNQGLMEDGTSKRRYKTNYLNIDSRFRVNEPSPDLGDAFILDDNPLDFNLNSKTIFIRHPNNPFQTGELIQLENASAGQVILRTIDSQGNETFEIPAGCNFMRVNYPHGLPLSYNGTNLQVEFKNIRGDRGNTNTTSFLGSIPTNILNSRFSVRLELTSDLLDPDCDLSNLPSDYLERGTDHFFVILPVTMHNPENEAPYVLQRYNFRILWLSIAGIPLNNINARYPLDINHRKGFHTIINRTDNGYNIELALKAIIDINGGGSCVTVSKIEKVNNGFPNPNSYTIDLGRTFHDVVSVRMISSEFPNSNSAVIAFPEEKRNNRIYWNDIDDGDFLYFIEIPQGNYQPTDLVTTMETLFLNTPRVNAGSDENATYESKHFMRVTIDHITSEVTFESFKEWCLILPITAVEPDIGGTGFEDPVTEANTQYTITINHPGHGMDSPGETIFIRDAIAYKGIPATTLNMEHVVSEIIDENNYKIELPLCSFNLLANRTDSRGGAAVRVLIPDLFRLRFDEDDTMGPLLGFRNSGNPNSVYPFSKKISNKDPYEFDDQVNSFGQVINIENNSLKLSGDDYVIMVAEPLITLQSIGPIKDAFAKILLCDIPGKVLFNTFINTNRIYEDPLDQVSELKVDFYSPDGTLFDFNGLDHSYTLEIITVNDIPDGTGISANTGKNYNINV